MEEKAKKQAVAYSESEGFNGTEEPEGIARFLDQSIIREWILVIRDR